MIAEPRDVYNLHCCFGFRRLGAVNLEMKLTSATVVVCSLRVNISTYLCINMPALDLKKWHEKLDRKLLLPAMFNQLLVVMSVIIFSVTIDQI